KPVELAVRAMQYSSRAGENVLDLFGGSGSTLIAAEQTGRKAYLMELDPLYTDVICERFLKFSGVEPVRESDGAKWSSLKAAGVVTADMWMPAPWFATTRPMAPWLANGSPTSPRVGDLGHGRDQREEAPPGGLGGDRVGRVRPSPRMRTCRARSS